MRFIPPVVVVSLLVITVMPVAADCVPYPAYVYEGIVKECRLAAVGDIRTNPEWVDSDAVREALEVQPVSVVTLLVDRIVQVAKCDWEKYCVPAVAGWDDVTSTEFRFQLEDECAGQGLDPGDSVRFYAVRSCCDVLPLRGTRCGLGLPVIFEPPDWAVDIVNDE